MRDAVADLDNSAHIIDLEIHVVVADLFFDDRCYFFRIHLHNLAVTPISLLWKGAAFLTARRFPWNVIEVSRFASCSVCQKFLFQGLHTA